MSGQGASVLIVGAGVAGLAAARDLEAAGFAPVVVDASDRVGGVMRTDRIRGYLVESGPNTFQAKAPLCSFLARHGLSDAICAAAPESSRRSLFRGDGLVALPHGPGSAVTTPLLSARGKLRLLGEPFVRRGDPTGESVHAFFARRVGSEIATNLVGAFLTGVYAGDEHQLGVEAVFPALAEYERTHGSLLRGGVASLREARASRRAAPAVDPAAQARGGTWSAPEGLGSFAAELGAKLSTPVRLSTRVETLSVDGAGWRAELSGPGGEEILAADAVVMAAPAFAAADLLEPSDADLGAGLRSIAYAPIAAIALGASPQQVRGEIEGFGFIIPRDAGMRLLGCLFMSRLFPGRAPEGRELLHLMVGGVRWPEAVERSDDELLGQVLPELDRCLGLAASPELVAVRRWPRAIPQPACDHTRTVAALSRAASRLPNLALAGSYVAGISVADALASGAAAAERLAGALRPGA